jgi:hypothetical protein
MQKYLSIWVREEVRSVKTREMDGR